METMISRAVIMSLSSSDGEGGGDESRKLVVARIDMLLLKVLSNFTYINKK